MTRLRLVAIGLTVAALVAVGAWFWLLHTDPGAKFVWRQAQSALGGAMQADSISGDLGSGLTVSGFRLEFDAVVVSLESASIAVDVDILPLAVELRSARGGTGSVRVRAGEDEPGESADPAELLERLRLPLRVVISDLALTDFVVAGLTGDRDLEVQELSFSGRWSDAIEIERLSLQAPEGSIDMNASLSLARPFDVAMQSQVAVMPALSGYPDPIEVVAEITGNLSNANVKVSTEPQALAVRGSVSNLLEFPTWDLIAETAQFEWPATDAAELRVTDARLSSVGNIDGFSLSFGGLAETAGLAPAKIDLDAKSTLGELSVDSLQVASSQFLLQGDGSLAWHDGLAVASNLRIERADLSAVLANWPAAHALQGSLSVSVDEQRVSISKSELTVAGTETRLMAEGEFALADGAVSGVLGWQQLRWPMDGEATILSRQGRVSVAGTTDEWQVDGRVDLATKGVDDGVFAVRGGGDRESAAIQIVEGSVLGGAVSGNASYSWQGEQAWAASLNISGIDPGSILSEWPGNISGRIDASGQVMPFALSTTIDELNGTLRGQRMAASGRLEFEHDRIAADDLYLQHGESQLRADGSLYGPEGLTVNAAIVDTALYVNDSSGSLHATGAVSLHEERPFVNLRASSERLRIGQLEVFDLAIIDHNDGLSVIDLEVAAQQLIVARETLDDVVLRVDADRDRQAVGIRSAFGRTAIDSRFVGSLDNWQEPSAWSGQVESLTVLDKGEPIAGLTSPAAVELTRSSFAIDGLCVVDQDAGLCIDAQWNADDYLDVNANLKAYPVDTVNLITETGFRFDQLVDGQVRWRSTGSGKPTGSARISVSPGEITAAADAGVRVRTQTGQLEFNIVDGALLEGTVNVPMPGTGAITGDLGLLDVSAGTSSEIRGSLRAHMEDIAVLAVLSPLVDSLGGELDAEFELGGTLQAPLVTGDFAFDRAHVDYRPIGLRLHDIELEGSLLDDRRVEIAGSFRAGDGRGEIDTRADFNSLDSRGLQLEIRGENLSIINVPDVEAVADVDANLAYDGDTLTLGGSVVVPRARITPENLAANRVGVSEDVVVVAGELPGERQVQEASKLRMLGSVEVALGDSVVVDLKVAKARISGAANFDWTGDPVPVANGRYDMTGNVAAFGQILEITEGGVRFPNVPANNPHVRLRAVREIFGNSQVKLAGILVSGTARRPTIEAYTVPLTTRERAMTLLVTGSDFDLEQGVGAIDFGTYIAPRLFVSYGVGIFDRENVISARYDLTRGFGVKATSGQKESGVDFIYRFER